MNYYYAIDNKPLDPIPLKFGNPLIYATFTIALAMPATAPISRRAKRDRIALQRTSRS